MYSQNPGSISRILEVFPEFLGYSWNLLEIPGIVLADWEIPSRIVDSTNPVGIFPILLGIFGNHRIVQPSWDFPTRLALFGEIQTFPRNPKNWENMRNWEIRQIWWIWENGRNPKSQYKCFLGSLQTRRYLGIGPRAQIPKSTWLRASPVGFGKLLLAHTWLAHKTFGQHARAHKVYGSCIRSRELAASGFRRRRNPKKLLVTLFGGYFNTREAKHLQMLRLSVSANVQVLLTSRSREVADLSTSATPYLILEYTYEEIEAARLGQILYPTPTWIRFKLKDKDQKQARNEKEEEILRSPILSTPNLKTNQRIKKKERK